jgi:hypothetical protein
MTQDSETPQTQGCGCPEVHLTDDEHAALASDSTCKVPEWIPYCWYREEFTETLGKLHSIQRVQSQVVLTLVWNYS